jgi:L-threonylcarbamoyladenylate synthase
MSGAPSIPRCLAAAGQPTPLLARQVAAVIDDGGVVVIPTETVYGLAAADTQAGLARLCACKGRDAGKPIALMAESVATVAAHLAARGAALPAAAMAVARRFWPGALTMVLGEAGRTEGYRVPDHALARQIIGACGGILRVTSANLSGAPDACTAAEALACLGNAVDLVVDEGAVRGGVASTVVRIDDDNRLTILREGPILRVQLEDAIAEATI